MRRRSAIAIALFALACSSPDPGVDEVRGALDGIVATCSLKSGDVQLKRADEGFWTGAEVASVFRAGDWVKTGAFSSARIELLAGGALELDEGATVVLEADPAARHGGAPLVSVQGGEVRGRLSAEENTPALKLKMADGTTAELSAKSGDPVEFRLSRGAEGTEVAVDRGSATLGTSRGSTELREGTAAALGRELRTFDLLTAPDLLAPLYEARVQFAAQAPVSLGWDALPGAHRYRLEVAKDAAFETQVEAAVVDGEAYDFVATAPGTFYWRVAGQDEAGRTGRFSAPRRLFLEDSEPAEPSARPEAGAVYQFPSTEPPPKLTFSWGGDGAGQYQLVIANGPDLWLQRVKVVQVQGTTAELEGLEAGRYFWGVYAVEPERPLFHSPRRLELRKTDKATLKTPRRINRWGN